MATAKVLSNPLGAQGIFDGGMPRSFTARAREVVSGGQFVTISGLADVSSGVSSYADGDLTVIGAIDNVMCNGMAINNAGSDELVTVVTRGGYLCSAGEIVSGGALVMHNNSGCVANILKTGSAPLTEVPARPIGTAMTTSASGTALYSLINLNI